MRQIRTADDYCHELNIPSMFRKIRPLTKWTKARTIRDMLKERVVWKKIEEFEVLQGRGNSAPIDQQRIVDALLNRPGFKDKHAITRAITDLINKKLVKPIQYSTGSERRDGLHTEPAGDDYFAWPYFWHKPLDAFGWGKIWGFLLFMTALIPDTFVNTLVEAVVQWVVGKLS